MRSLGPWATPTKPVRRSHRSLRLAFTHTQMLRSGRMRSLGPWATPTKHSRTQMLRSGRMRSLGPWATPTKHSRTHANASIGSDAEPRAMGNPNETFTHTRKCFDRVGCGASGHGQPQRNIHAHTQMLRSGRMRSLGPWATPTKLSCYYLMLTFPVLTSLS